MPKRHRRHTRHRPAGLHQTAAQLEELRSLGVPQHELDDILKTLKEQIPEAFLAKHMAASGKDPAITLASNIETANLETVAMLKRATVLIAGELRPHLIDALLDEGVVVTQVHDASPHGGSPPHFRDLTRHYGKAFNGSTSFSALRILSPTTVVFDAFVQDSKRLLVSPLVLMATRLWPMASLTAVPSDHEAPHHIVELDRDADFHLFWE